MFLIFLSQFIKIAFGINSGFFSQKYARNNEDRNFLPQGLQIAALLQSFSQCWWKRPILEGSLIYCGVAYCEELCIVYRYVQCIEVYSVQMCIVYSVVYSVQLCIVYSVYCRDVYSIQCIVYINGGCCLVSSTCCSYWTCPRSHRN